MKLFDICQQKTSIIIMSYDLPLEILNDMDTTQYNRGVANLPDSPLE